MDEWYVHIFIHMFRAVRSHYHAKAAYQVGLTFLTTHMRRAVAACTSPEVFFGANVSGLAAGPSHIADNFLPTDALNLALGNLDMNTAIATSV